MRILQILAVFSILLASCGGSESDSEKGQGGACPASLNGNCVTQPCIYAIDLSSCGTGGNLGGVNGADDYCNTVKPWGVNSAKALIGAPGVRSTSIDWPLQPNTTYRRPDGLALFTTDGSAIFPFGALTNSLGVSKTVWTGLNPSWTVDSNCSNWTSNSGLRQGAAGDSNSSVSRFIYNVPIACNSTNVAILCVAQ